MNDGVLVEALRARDPGALAALYDTYAEPLYRYCRAMLDSPDTAQVALRDTLIAAEALVGSLADHEMVRPWLYALARGECSRRRTPSRGAGHREPGGGAPCPGDEPYQSGPGGADAPNSALHPPGRHEIDAPATKPQVDESTGAERSGSPRANQPAEPADVPEADGMESQTFGASEVADPAETELRMVAWHAVTALNLADREILELTTRHDLSIAEVATIFGVAQRVVADRYKAATARLGDAITAEILARRGANECSRAAAILAGTTGPVGRETRGQLLDHLARCPSCARHRARHVSPAKVFALLPQPSLPSTLRVRVLSCFVDPELVPYRRYVAKRVGPLASSGFPRAGAVSQGRVAQAIAGAVATIAAVAAVTLVFAQFTEHRRDPAIGAAAQRPPASGRVGADLTGTGLGMIGPDGIATPTDSGTATRSAGPGDPAERVITVIPAELLPLPTPVPRPAPPPSRPREPLPSSRPTTSKPVPPRPTHPSITPTGRPSVPPSTSASPSTSAPTSSPTGRPTGPSGTPGSTPPTDLPTRPSVTPSTSHPTSRPHPNRPPLIFHPGHHPPRRHPGWRGYRGGHPMPGDRRYHRWRGRGCFDGERPTIVPLAATSRPGRAGRPSASKALSLTPFPLAPTSGTLPGRTSGAASDRATRPPALSPVRSAWPYGRPASAPSRWGTDADLPVSSPPMPSEIAEPSGIAEHSGIAQPPDWRFGPAPISRVP